MDCADCIWWIQLPDSSKGRCMRDQANKDAVTEFLQNEQEQAPAVTNPDDTCSYFESKELELDVDQ